MKIKKRPFTKKKVAPKNSWEAGFGKLITPLEQFIKSEANSGILLVVCTLVALIIANGPLFHAYEEILNSQWMIGGADSFNIKLSLHHWINDGLMTLFFFLVGLEIKREILVGELSVFRKALLPIFAAIGGMVIPALFYYLINKEGVGADGWGIPMATDIAFAVATLVLLGNRCPKALMTFVIALAIVDDIGAVLVIAIFYTSEINIISLMWAGMVFVLLILCNISGIRKSWVYAVLGVILWGFMYHSGIHATVAGILAAFAIPARAKYKPRIFVNGARKLMDRFDVSYKKDSSVLRNESMMSILQTLKRGLTRAQTPLQNLEHANYLPVNFLIIPVFSLANSAIPIDVLNIGSVLTDSITIGIIVGLVLGKPVGIVLATWVAVKMKICTLPENTTMQHIVGAGFLAGIGFTMSVFITELAFSGQKEILVISKTGILLASIMAAVIGFVYLVYVNKKTQANASQLVSLGKKDG